ncbi:hypothetical protein Tco_1453095, partial [Tanacetum coccineum]
MMVENSLYVVHSLEGGIDNEEEDNCLIENDMDKELVDSDANSVASVDHLSKGEEELRQVRLKKAKSKIKSQEREKYVEPDVDSDRDMPGGDSDDEMNDTDKYQLWYEKSDSKKLLVKCGFDQKKKKGKTVDPSKPKVENTENWEWFLQHLRQDLDLNDGTRVARISNGHK